MKLMTVLITMLAVTIVGCASTARKINKVSLGMTKAEVIKVMGHPTSTSAQAGVEYMNYALYETKDARRWGHATPYFVRIKEGKVDAYGRTGDFDSTKSPESTINVNVNKAAENP